MSYDYDLFVIGGGSGGVRAARWAAPLGAKVAICEEHRYGGTCVLKGCIPKKMMVYGSHFAKDIKVAKDYGWDMKIEGHDWKAFKESRAKELSRLSGLYEKMLGGKEVEVISGRGVLKDAHTVEVGDKTFTAKNIIIAVGGRPWMPDIPGKELALNSDQFFELDERPKRVVVYGAGFIGIEFACLLNHFGSEVHVVYRRETILREFDQEAACFLQDQMEKEGIHFHLMANIEAIEEVPHNELKVVLNNGTSVVVDQVVMATGRKPLTKNLGLEKTKVQTDKNGAIKVDEYSQTHEPSIYAVGDVTNRMNLTPVALQEGMLVAEELFNANKTPMRYENIPSAVYSQPPMATVGLTEEECKLEEREIEVYTSNFRPLKYTLGEGQTRSFMKMIVEKTTKKVIGLHMVGDDAPEIMQGFAVALKLGATKEIFDQTIGLHPTSAEEFVTMRTPREKKFSQS